MSERKKIVKAVKGHLQYLQEEGITNVRVARTKKADKNTTTKQSASKKLNKREAIVALKETTDRCTKCAELVKNRNNVVFGAGNVSAKLMFIGEAPGRDEDQQGLPFVGRAGQLLTKMIESIGLTRQQVFIANVLKCRPPKNRNPLPVEIMNCEPYLLEQLKLIQPHLICALGTFSAQMLLKSDLPISRLRGQFHDYYGIKVLPTFHPAYLLRSPSEKRKAWEDMKRIKKELGL